MKPLWAEIRRRAVRANEIIGELTMGPTLLRLTVVVAAFAGLVIAWSGQTRTPAILITFGVVGLATGVFPRSPLPTMCALIMLAGYLGETGTGIQITVWRVSTLAGLIYIMHTAAAYASLLPYNAVLTRGMFVPYIMRTVAVIAITVGLTYFGAEVTSIVTAKRNVGFTIAGMLSLVGIASYVAYLGSRRRPPALPQQRWTRRNPERVAADGHDEDAPATGQERERADR